MANPAEKSEESEVRITSASYEGDISTRTVVVLGVTVVLLGLLLWYLVASRFRG
jgi:hypothetical protein